MPEFREALAHYLLLFWLWNKHKTSYVLLGIWADFTAAEVKRTGKAKDGLVQKLGPTCTFKRGSKGGQTHLFPQDFRKTKGEQDPPSLDTLELTAIEHTSRAIFLTFGSLRLKVAYLTHTSIQFYKRDHWEQSIRTVAKENRGKIGIALEFKEYVVAFISHDLVFQPVWERTVDPLTKIPLPPIPPPIYDDYIYFLKKVADWVERRASGRRLGLACEVIRSTQDVWHGVGVYTVCELFFIAGLSLFLTEAEVFNCPSRTARLCEAFFSYAYYSKENLPSLLKSAMVDEILAPTQEQRLKYLHWLHVYAKDTTSVPSRMAKLADSYNTTLQKLEGQAQKWCRESVTLHDVFDPVYIRDAFENKDINLGHLVFGDKDWKYLRGSACCSSDPLSEMFCRRGLLESKTYLSPNGYDVLYPSPNRSAQQFRPTYAYSAKKQIWSITRCFPPNSYLRQSVDNDVEEGFEEQSSIEDEHDVDDSNEPNSIVEHLGIDRTRRLFKTIVLESQGVAIGPLEYCGNGRIVRLSSGKKKVAIVHKADPQLSTYQITRQAQRDFRLKSNLGGPGKAKVAMTKEQRTAQDKFIQKALDMHQISVSLAGPASELSTLCAEPPTPHLPSESCCSSFPISLPSSPSVLPPSSPLPSSSNFSSSSPPQSPSTSQYSIVDLTNRLVSHPQPTKKRRISQDRRLALFGQLTDTETVSENIQNTSKRRLRFSNSGT